ncbi:Small-conductance mechanosensitive ion channel-like protein [Sesbania bispinosa]|nr:Small-conductance mechanosensitive ion channel-like protein [Sesbania bispinosa]
MEKIPLIPYIHMHVLDQCQTSNFAGQSVFHRNQAEISGVVGGGIVAIDPPAGLGWEVGLEIGTMVHDILVLEKAHGVVVAGLWRRKLKLKLKR